MFNYFCLWVGIFLITSIKTKEQKEIRLLLKLEKSSPIVMDEGTAEEVTEWRTPDGTLHRDFGPAVIWPDGESEWWRDWDLHRDEGPAVEMSSGTAGWYRQGKLHREDGPAIIDVGVDPSYYLFGILYKNKEEWINALAKL